ncbi:MULTISPECIES: GntR family transcriptional regulator [Acidithrix]|jgi:DNA-binding transcriptional regulator YhcF (GntR family)|uniref:HTH-type transcriptional repressor YtrA n=1 Tax=Acidithrix ferrooxidans TaxID=1280514 RepID=A0A0D8HCM6_9ACTN|nr:MULTISPECIES: GntR family transcriptional regulator [Acidithrix]KJF15542.1 HTH-type transcriptional repressor YtrA [Acidithrix ferrooxidans]CAG4926208.1 unnamed protein product [Acidithrix sp. C25]
MLIRIDTNSSVPLFEQITSALRRAIADGSLPGGSPLPPARELAEGLEVNMHTVLRAYQILCAEDLVNMRRGRGAYVSDNHPDSRALIIEQVQGLVLQAKRLGFNSDEVVELIKGAMA